MTTSRSRRPGPRGALFVAFVGVLAHAPAKAATTTARFGVSVQVPAACMIVVRAAAAQACQPMPGSTAAAPVPARVLQEPADRDGVSRVTLEF